MEKKFVPLFICFVAIAIYALGVNGPFILDDSFNLSPLARLGSGEISKTTILFGNVSGMFGRSVSMATFLFDYLLHGYSPLWFKITNVVLHATTGFLIYVFLTLVLSRSPYAHRASGVALFVMAAWLLSPLFASTVLYAVQRMAILAALFVVAALIAYIKLRESILAERLNLNWLILLVLFGLLGVFSKENAALLPLFIIVTEYFLCPPPENIEKQKLRDNIFLIGVIVPGVIAALFMCFHHERFFDYSSRSFNLEQRLLTQARIVWSYIGELMLPKSSSFGLFHDDIKISQGLTTPISTFVSLIAWLVVVALVAVAYKSAEWRIIAGAAMFYMMGHLMESTIFPLELYFEHRNYLPGLGIYLLIALLVIKLNKSKLVSDGLLKVTAYIYVTAFAIALSQRALMWTSYDLLIASSYAAHPNSPRTNIEGALRDAFSGRFEMALAKIEHVKELTPEDALGANLQIIYTHCLYNAAISKEQIEGFAEAKTSSSTYASTAIAQLNDLYREAKCDQVPYKEFIVVIAERYLNALIQKKSKDITDLSKLQIPMLEGLNYFGLTDKTIQLAEDINNSGNGGFAVDLVTAVALIDQGRLVEARSLIDKQKLDQSTSAKMQASQLQQVEELYQQFSRGRS